MTTRAPKNTRRHRRMTVRILVDYQADGGIHCDYATTLGAGGMFLRTSLPLERGDDVKLRFRIPGGATLHEIGAKVTWAYFSKAGEEKRTPGVGLQFTDAAAIARLARELEDYAATV